MKSLLERRRDAPINYTTAFGRATSATPPILTRNPTQSVAGYDHKGLPISKTPLGDYRQGDGGAIAEGQMFPPIPFYPTPPAGVFFQNIGNNVYQPQENSAATHALITRLGDQQFKARENDPYAQYFAEQRLAREVQDSERTAGLEELGLSREILRNLVSSRREQNEADYMRRALDAGMSPDDAKDELDGLRRNHHLAEMKAEDRTYQAKLLITRIAASRGLASAVQEPLDRSAAIHNPQPSQQMSIAMGNPEGGFGTGQLDVARQFLTPDYYRRMLRRTAMTSEAADRQTATNNAFLDDQQTEAAKEAAMAAAGTLQTHPSNVRSIAVNAGLEREAELERSKELVAARLDVLRRRGEKLRRELPEFLFAKPLLENFFGQKKPGDQIRYVDEVFSDMSMPQLLVAVNQYVVTHTDGAEQMIDALKANGYPNMMKQTYRRDLIRILEQLTGKHKLDVPLTSFPASHGLVKSDRVLEAIRNFVNSDEGEIAAAADFAGTFLEHLEAGGSEPQAGLDLLGRPLEEVAGEEALRRGYSRPGGANPLLYRGGMSAAGGGGGTAEGATLDVISHIEPGTTPGITLHMTEADAAGIDAEAGVVAPHGGGGARAAVPAGRPAKSKPAADWKAWAERHGIPTPHTKASLMERYP